MRERLRDRLGEQLGWKPAAVAVAIVAALAVVVIGSSGQPAPMSSAGQSGLGASVVTGGRQVPSAGATAAARRFLAGYLPFLYGQAGRGALGAVTPQLRGWLGAHRDRVTPAERARYPRLVALAFAPRDRSRSVLFEATIADGGSGYRLRLRVVLQAGEWRVTELPDARTAVGPSGAD
jgi:hypothetical protein